MDINKETLESIFIELIDNGFKIKPIIENGYIRVKINNSESFKFYEIAEPINILIDYITNIFECEVKTMYNFLYEINNGEDECCTFKQPYGVNIIEMDVIIKKKKDGIIKRMLKHIKLYKEYEN